MPNPLLYRTEFLPLINKSGALVNYGDVVILGSSTAKAFNTTNVADYKSSHLEANTDANGNGTQPGTGVPNVFSVRENQANKELQLDGYAQVNTSVFYRFVAGYIIE